MGEITAKSIKNEGLCVDGIWYNAKKVWAYASKLEKGDKVNIKLDEAKKQILFVEKLNADFKQPESKENKDYKGFEDRQKGIEETAKLRRELDLFITALNNSIALCVSKEIKKEEIFEYTKGFINLREEINKPVNFTEEKIEV